MKIRNLLKSQAYQFTREPIAWVVLAIYIYMGWQAVAAVRENGGLLARQLNEPAITGGIAAGNSSINLYVPVLLLAVCLTAVTVCRDFENQTIKYDILAGYTSAQAVYGRLLFSMAAGLIAALLYVLLPVVWFSVKNGYGTAVPFSGYVMSVAICMLLLVRMELEIAWLSVRVRKTWLVCLITSAVCVVEYLIYSRLITAAENGANSLPYGMWMLIPACSVILTPGDLLEMHYTTVGEITYTYHQFPDAVSMAVLLAGTAVCLVLSVIRIRQIAVKRDID